MSERGPEADRENHRQLTLRPVDAADHFLLTRWVRQEDISQWFGSSSVGEAELRFAQQSESSLARMILLGERCIGYAHAVDLYQQQQIERYQEPAIPTGSYDMTLFIGEEDCRGQGYGPKAIEKFVSEIFSTTLAVGVSVMVSLRAEQIVRIYERLGFQWRGVLEVPLTGPAWVLYLERTST